MSTLGETAAAAAERLHAAGLTNARLDARLLVAHAAALPAEAVVLDPGRPVPPLAAARARALVARRLAGEPVAKIVGVREFWGLPFRTTAGTLDPRPDSETVIDAALALLADRAAPLRVLDLGTGTGCLLLAVLAEFPAAHGVGVDKSPAALAVARENAENLGLAGRATFVAADWARGIGGVYDCILANPPYLRSAEIAAAAPEVARHEPRLALDGGPEGLDAYRALAPQIAARLSATGAALLEVGYGQAPDVCDILEQAGLRTGRTFKDLAGIDRVVAARVGDSRFVE